MSRLSAKESQCLRRLAQAMGQVEGPKSQNGAKVLADQVVKKWRNDPGALEHMLSSRLDGIRCDAAALRLTDDHKGLRVAEVLVKEISKKAPMSLRKTPRFQNAISQLDDIFNEDKESSTEAVA